MSVKLRFSSAPDGGLLHRSRSFTGFSSLTASRSSSSHNSLRSKSTAGGKSPRMHLSPRRGSSLIWSLQPEQVDQVFQALRRGLREQLLGLQAEMDFLSAQQRETRRNSRLAFLYDLEKEIRALERFMRRLEFQISKVEELCEAYCIQWRLSQGAANMRTAFSLSPSSRGTRDSLLELDRTHRDSLQDMLAMEEELELLLGELHIKMKGLIGFARLCPGDQYEVVVRLGRQRWRIRGRIESDDSQSWDQEETIFLPHIHHNFQIKVTEAKGLGWPLVGMVTCSSADFFVVQPQLMLVDVTELGTIKLQLEVTWSPFDSSQRMKPPSSVSRQSLSSRKSSVYSWTAPNTPSFTEKYFMSMVGQLQEQDAMLPPLLSRRRPPRGGVSLLGFLSEPPPTSASPPSLHPDSVTPAVGSPSSRSAGTSPGGREPWGAGPDSPSAPEGGQRWSTPDILRRSRGGGAQAEERQADGVQNSDSQPFLVSPSDRPPVASPPPSGGARGRSLALRLGALMAEVEKGLTEQSSQDRRLRALDHQIRHLGTILKNNLSLMRRSEEEEEEEEAQSLAVEEVLESFDFLSQDLTADDDLSCLGSLRLKDSGIGSPQRSSPRSLGLRQDGQQPLFAPLTSGNWSLDQALETHLDICCLLLQMLDRSDFQPSRTELLEEMSLQAAVLDRVSGLLLEKSDRDLVSSGDVLPTAQTSRDLLLFWDECVKEASAPFCCSVDQFCRALKRSYTHRVKAKQPGQSDRVFAQLVQQVQAVCRALPPPRPLCTPDRVSVFQLWGYLKRWGVQELGEHIHRLSREEFILSALRGPKRRRALNKLRGRSLAELLPLTSTLQTLAGLQTDSNHKVCKAAASCVCRAAGCRTFRSQALLYYTESLRSSDLLVQQGSCLALKCLRAVESVDQISDLWRSADEDLRASARETILSFGKRGHQAFQRMDQLYSDMQDEVFQNQETLITVL